MQAVDERDRALNKIRERLQRQTVRKGFLRVQCPHCGTMLRTRPGQQDSFCYGCLQAIDLRTAESDALARAARDGVQNYAGLLELGEEQLRQGSYLAAADTYRAACAIDSRSAAAWRGWLLADTEEFHKEGRPPQDLYERALQQQSPAEAERLRREWEAYAAYQIRREEARNRRRQYAQQRRQAEQTQRTQSAPGTDGRRGGRKSRFLARTLIVLGCVAGIFCLLLASRGFGFVLGAAMLSMLGRRRDR